MAVVNFTNYGLHAIAHMGGKIVSNKGKEYDLGGVTASWGDFAEANGVLFCTPDYDGGKPVQVKVGGLPMRDTTAKTSPDRVLHAGVLAEHSGVLFAARVSEEDGMHLSRLRWSAFAEPENFEPFGAGNFQNFEDIGNPDDEIVRLVSFGSNLVIFKKRSVWVAYGLSQTQISPEYIRQVSNDFGLVGPNALVKTDRSIVFLSAQGLAVYDGETFNTASGFTADIQPHVEWRDKKLLEHACLDRDPTTDTYYLLLPRYKKRNEDCFVFSNGAWTRWEFGKPISTIRTVKLSTGEFYTRIGDYDGGLYEFKRDARTDVLPTRTIFNPKYQTDWIDFGDKRKKLMRSLELVLRLEGDFPLKVEVYYDYSLVPHSTHVITNKDGQPTLDNSQLDIDAATVDRRMYIHHFIDLDASAVCVRFRFIAEGENNRFRIYRATVGYITRGGV